MVPSECTKPGSTLRKEALGSRDTLASSSSFTRRFFSLSGLGFLPRGSKPYTGGRGGEPKNREKLNHVWDRHRAQTSASLTAHTHHHHHSGLGLLLVDHAHNGFYATSYLFCRVTMVICAYPDDDDLGKEREKNIASFYCRLEQPPVATGCK